MPITIVKISTTAITAPAFISSESILNYIVAHDSDRVIPWDNEKLWGIKLIVTEFEHNFLSFKTSHGLFTSAPVSLESVVIIS